ncbi:DUF7281 domain-containing protein [Vibrio mediterranei]|uniref:DUF7281 domain-containing protein n=1 Tax=Vibrio mediterranei TaxID=689 RepID=UPI004067EA76
MHQLYSAIALANTGVIPPGLNAVISVDPGELVIPKVERLVLVENGALLVERSRLFKSFPPPWNKNVLVGYRGHGQSQNQLKTLLKTLSPTAQLAFFFDYDFAGMCLVHSLMKYVPCAASLITPINDGVNLKLHSNESNLAKQYLNGQHLLSKTRGSDLDYEQVIFEETRCMSEANVAVVQERLISHRITLQSTPLNNLSRLK